LQRLTYLFLFLALGTPSKDKPSLTAFQRLHNLQISQYRVVVENVNSRIKRYRVLGGQFRHFRLVDDPEDSPPNFEFLEKIVRVIAALTNLSVERGWDKPFRGAAWTAPQNEVFLRKLDTQALNEFDKTRDRVAYDNYIRLREMGRLPDGEVKEEEEEEESSSSDDSGDDVVVMDSDDDDDEDMGRGSSFVSDDTGDALDQLSVAFVHSRRQRGIKLPSRLEL
jgi:hypothetical protein